MHISTRLSKFLVLGIATVLIVSAIDYMRLLGYEWGPGWDFKCGCDAAYALFKGLNPYKSLDYSFIRNSFTYLPFWLPIHGLLCMALNVTDVATTIIYYPVYLGAFLLALRLATIKSYFASFERSIFAGIILSGLAGFLWIMRTGNIAFLDTIFFLFAITCLLRFCQTQKLAVLRAFAVLFGCFMAVKTATLAFVVLMVLLPTSPRRKLEAVAIALGVALLPLLISYAVYPNLMVQYFLMLQNNIEGNVNPHLCSVSVYCLFLNEVFAPTALPLRADFTHILSQAVPTLLLTSAIVYLAGTKNRRALLSLATRDPERRLSFQFKGSSFDLFLLAFIYLQILTPRLKEYTFGLIAIAFAHLVVRMPVSPREKVCLAFYLSIPVLRFFVPIDVDRFFYVQLFVAITAFLYITFRCCEEIDSVSAKDDASPITYWAGRESTSP